MLDYKTLYNSDPFGLPIKKKNSWFLIKQRKLSLYHYKYSKNYKLISDNIFKSISKVKKIADLPFVHASLFKNFNLISCIIFFVCKTDQCHLIYFFLISLLSKDFKNMQLFRKNLMFCRRNKDMPYKSWFVS